MGVTSKKYTLGRTIQPSSDSVALVLTKNVWNSLGTKNVDDIVADGVHYKASETIESNSGVSLLQDKDGNNILPLNFAENIRDENNLENVQNVVNKLKSGEYGIVKQTDTSGWFIIDKDKHILLRYNSDGLDAAKVSDHLKQLIYTVVSGSSDLTYDTL